MARGGYSQADHAVISAPRWKEAHRGVLRIYRTLFGVRETHRPQCLLPAAKDTAAISDDIGGHRVNKEACDWSFR